LEVVAQIVRAVLVSGIDLHHEINFESWQSHQVG